MQDFRMIGYRIKEYAKEKGVSDSALSSIIGCDVKKMDSVYCGRYYLAYDHLESIAKYLGVDVLNLLEGKEEGYNAAVVHCMNDFSNINNREMILDIIDDYVDIIDALGIE